MSKKAYNKAKQIMGELEAEGMHTLEELKRMIEQEIKNRTDYGITGLLPKIEPVKKPDSIHGAPGIGKSYPVESYHCELCGVELDRGYRCSTCIRDHGAD